VVVGVGEIDGVCIEAIVGEVGLPDGGCAGLSVGVVGPGGVRVGEAVCPVGVDSVDKALRARTSIRVL